MGIIRLHGMTFYGYHGVSAAEKELARRFIVDIEFPLDTKKAAETDNLEETINYEEIFRTCENIMTTNKFHLIETLAERIAQKVYSKFNLIGVRVKVRKTQPPFPGHIEFVEVETTCGEI